MNKSFQMKSTTSLIPYPLLRSGPLGEVVQIGKAKGYFVAWVDRNPIPGGILHWIQGDTYVEMESMTITKEQMIEVARSMR